MFYYFKNKFDNSCFSTLRDPRTFGVFCLVCTCFQFYLPLQSSVTFLEFSLRLLLSRNQAVLTVTRKTSFVRLKFKCEYER